jgi:hypothetical protein
MARSNASLLSCCWLNGGVNGNSSVVVDATTSEEAEEFPSFLSNNGERNRAHEETLVLDPSFDIIDELVRAMLDDDVIDDAALDDPL